MDSYRCPKGHELPKKFNGVNCTPVTCAAELVMLKETFTAKDKLVKSRAKRSLEKAEIALRYAKSAADSPDIDTEGHARAAEAEETRKLSQYSGKHKARLAYSKVPAGLEGADAEEFADRKIVQLLPDAVAEVEFQLKYGDDKQRMDAATKVLDATGRGKREAMNGSGSPIVILTGNAVISPPWRKAAPQPAVIDVTPTVHDAKE